MPKDFICTFCGKHFQDKPSKNRIYCSRECQHKDAPRRTAERRKSKMIPCAECGEKFYPHSDKAKFCSHKCFGTYNREGDPRACETCGEEFYVQPSHEDRYCSWECYNESRYTGEWDNCKTCGKPFYKSGYLAREDTENNFYCSRECWRNRPDKTGENRNCLNCGKVFYVDGSKLDATFCCCQRCADEYKGPTNIERFLMEELDNRNIEYEWQYRVDRWAIDIAFPGDSVAVEADGVYWHSLPENIRRDKRKDRDLSKRGWTVLRFSGDKIKESPSDCVKEIINHLNTE